jgi:hypothetical protein
VPAARGDRLRDVDEDDIV